MQSDFNRPTEWRDRDLHNLCYCMRRTYLLIDLNPDFMTHGFDGQCSRGLFRIIGHCWVSLDECTRCAESCSQLVCLFVFCRKSVSESAEPHGLFTRTQSCVLQCTGPCVCRWPIFVDVLSYLKLCSHPLSSFFLHLSHFCLLLPLLAARIFEHPKCSIIILHFLLHFHFGSTLISDGHL